MGKKDHDRGWWARVVKTLRLVPSLTTVVVPFLFMDACCIILMAVAMRVSWYDSTWMHEFIYFKLCVLSLLLFVCYCYNTINALIFVGLNFHRSRVFAIFVFFFVFFCGWRIFAVFVFASSSQPLPLRRKNLLRSGISRHLGIKSKWMGILKFPINARTRRKDPVTAHTWPYKCFLSSSRIQLTMVSMKIRHLCRN